ncbi:TRAF3-interacting protein 1 [Dinochytrium kinnereticum]|nr:TRAF3-interacting protein 1 [Dinochytrium kinnereticum]
MASKGDKTNASDNPSASNPNSIEEAVKKSIDILSKVIKKPPLTAKLLSKPPFRYLHDMFSEIIKTTSFAAGLYDDAEMSSDNVKVKNLQLTDSKKNLIVDAGISTGVEVKANPLKIVAGMDPDETNAFLQLLGKAVLKKVDTTDAVKKVRAGEHQKKGGAPKAQPSASSSQPSAKPPPTASAPPPAAKQSQPATTAKPSAGAVPSPTSEIKPTSQKAPAEKPPPSASAESAVKSQPPVKETTNEKKAHAPPLPQSAHPRSPEKAVDHSSEPFQYDENVSKQVDVQDRDDDGQNDDERGSSKNAMAPVAIKRRERPSSARPAPPKVRPAELAVVEELPILSPGIIQDTKPDDDDEDDSFLIIQNDKSESNGGQAESQAQDENHGGLVRKILETKVKLEGKQSDDSKGQERPAKDKNTARREIEALRESIQSLCRNTNPLAKTLDYLQEDVDSMNKELESWKVENKRHKILLENELRETKEIIAPLEVRLKQVESGIEDLIDKISNSKATIIQNDASLQRLLRNITHPVK